MRWLYSTVLSTLLLLVLSTNATAQEVVKAFTQRTSTHAQTDYIKPGSGGKIYNLRGDFKMAGNTNLMLTNYTDNGSNNTDMSYVDIDLDGTTINSSSSFLDITNDACTEIVYAGLYWSGRANTGNMSFNVSGTVQTAGTTTTQTLNHTHNGTNNLDATTVTINRNGTNNNYYAVQLVKIGNKDFEFTINNDGTINKRERVNNGTWSASTLVAATITDNTSSNSSESTSGTTSNTTSALSDNGNTETETRIETRTRTQTTVISGIKVYTLATPITYTYNGVQYTISVVASYFMSSASRDRVETRTQTRTRTKRSNGSWRNWSSWSGWSNWDNGAYGNYGQAVYNVTDFTNVNNNYVTIQGPKTSIGTTNYNGTLTKNVIKFKKENGTYQTIIANTSDIQYPNGNYNDIYAAYADVTEYVRTNKGGNYFVADLATTAGDDSGSTGYYGGWGLVVVYANPTMKWRDITVFDGYAYMQGNNYEEFSLTGFQAAQGGSVNITMGMMAGEGDRSIEGDNFRIQTGTSTNWTYLSHSGNSTNNFFNSSIQVDGVRNPSLVNNTGIDIAKFDVPNPNNSIIGNGQTSTKFRYGSDGTSSSGNRDTYVIYNVVFAVDAYVPETEVLAQITPTAGVDINNLQPNDEVTLTADIFNYGSDAISNGNLQITIPAGMQLVSTSVNTNSQTASGATASYSFNTPTWINPTGGSNAIPAASLGGILEWKLGNVPTQNLVNGNKVPMATLTYKLKVTDNCVILQASKDNCILLPEVEGKITGKGVNSGANFEQVLITGYNADCNNSPIYGGLNMEIKPLPTFLDNCSANNPVVNEVRMFKRFCSVAGNVIPRTEITSVYPIGTKFYTDGGVEVIGDFAVNANGTVINYRAVLSGAPISCYLKLATQIDVITTQPTTTNVTVCQGESIVLNNQPSNAAYQLFYFQNQTDTTQMTGEPAPTTAGVHTYWVAEGTTNGSTTCFGPKKSFTITINAAPTALVLENVELCTFADYVSTINANGATATWEYYNGATWVVVNTQLAGVAIVANQLKITKAPATLNGTKFRVKLTNTNNCSSVSNEMTLTVKGCQMPVNPMIYTPLKR